MDFLKRADELRLLDQHLGLPGGEDSPRTRSTLEEMYR